MHTGRLSASLATRLSANRLLYVYVFGWGAIIFGVAASKASAFNHFATSITSRGLSFVSYTYRKCHKLEFYKFNVLENVIYFYKTGKYNILLLIITYYYNILRQYIGIYTSF